MFVLTDEAIDIAIDNISGYIVSVVAERLNMPVKDVSAAFLASDTYALLGDKETGYYWDNIGELVDRFVSEISDG